ncbi:MAG: hypothetical protein RIT45_704, partial [Pseudomonadota bacterium]
MRLRGRTLLLLLAVALLPMALMLWLAGGLLRDS